MKGLVRSCGTREAGGVYSEIPTGEDGKPIEYFLIDPPIPIDIEALGITPLGVQLVEVDGVYHIYDWVGENHYPYVADFAEEARHYGISRRLSKQLDFSKLTPESRHILIHAKALVENWKEAFDSWPPYPVPGQSISRRGRFWRQYGVCPLPYSGRESVPGHADEFCAGNWWVDYQEVDVIGVGAKYFRHTSGSMVEFAVGVQNTVERKYTPAIFCVYPIGHLTVIRDLVNESHNETAKKVGQSKLPVKFEDE